MTEARIYDTQLHITEEAAAHGSRMVPANTVLAVVRGMSLAEAARQLCREWFVHLRFPGHEHTRITNGVPEEWKRQRLGNIAECVGGGTPSTSVASYWEDGDVTWVTPTDVTRNNHFVLLDSEKKITEAGLQNSSAKLVPPHAVLMTSRASVGFFAVAARDLLLPRLMSGEIAV
jgi:type I restriction enzyme S subunit